MDKKWYEGKYRRSLVDMHIADWDEVFLSRFSPEEYVENLKKAKIQAAMIYLQSHTGLTNFPSKVGHHHPFIEKGNKIRELIRLCQANGIAAIGYYSIIFNNDAAFSHPSWQIRDKEGRTWGEVTGVRYGLCCPNNEEYRKFLKTQIQEMLSYFPELDAIFYDMPYWEVLCHCPSCQKKWKGNHPDAIPNEIHFDDPVCRDYLKVREIWMGEICRFVKEESLKVRPDITVEFNYAACVNCDWLSGSTERVNDECEFASGDLYGDLFHQSFSSTYYRSISRHQPFEYMTCRCDASLREHTITKDPNLLSTQIMLTAAHHGASLIIDAINPDGTMNDEFYDTLGSLFEKEIPYEPYLSRGSNYADIALYFDSETQFPYENRPSNKELAMVAAKTLIENHIPYDILSNGNHEIDWKKYQALVVPGYVGLSEERQEELLGYVRQGGNLYLSGLHDALIQKIFSASWMDESNPAKKIGAFSNVRCYLAPKGKTGFDWGEFDEKSPLPVSEKLPRLISYEGEILATITYPYTDPDDPAKFASIHSNPPMVPSNHPAMLEARLGKGRIVWSLFSLEGDARYSTKKVFVSLLRSFIKSPLYEIEGSQHVEAVAFLKGKELILSFVDYDYAFDPMQEKTIRVRSERFSSTLGINGAKVEAKEGGYEVKFTQFAMVQCLLKE